MRRALTAIALLLSLLSVGVRTSEAPVNGVRVLTVGDSNTHGHGVTPWPFHLAAYLHDARPKTDYVVDDRGVSGTTSGETAAEMSVYLQFNPDIVGIMTGTNDVDGSDWPSGPRQTKAQTEANIRSIIEQSLAATSTSTPSGHPLVVLLQPPVAVDRANRSSYVSGKWRAYDDAEGENSLTFVKELDRRLAAEYDIPLVATWDEFAALGYDGRRWGPVWLLQDGVHLTQPAQKDLARWVCEAILPSLDATGAVAGR